MTADKTNIILTGVPASPGVAIGKVFLFEDDEFVFVEKAVPKNKIKEEIVRLQQAMAKTRTELQENQVDLGKMLGKNYAKIADAHMLILDDPMLNKEAVALINEGNNAEFAVYKVTEKITKSFDLINDEYFRERKHDIIDVSKKIMRHLLGKQKKTLADLDSASIVVAKNLTPADTVSMREAMVRGFATDTGGKTSHTALVAQSLEIPAVVGLKNITGQVSHGMSIIVDGNQGIVILNPSKETQENYKREHDIQIAQQKNLEKLKDLPATTIDGKEVMLGANIENPEEVRSVLKHGANGIGLYRSEFMYLTRKTLPTEEEHYNNYLKVAKMMMPYEVIIRTIDLGGDKISKLGLMNITQEANPFMGLRAIRLCLKYPDLFKTQLKGILRASVTGNVKIMYPMITQVEEIRQANEILNQAKAELRKEGKKFDEDVQVGAMIEVPSVAVITDIIAKEVDFLSIGTNDLIQYTMAVDRVNEDVAFLYDPLHPAILRLLKNIIESGHNAGKSVGMCGEMAGSPEFTIALLGLGLDEFSMSAIQIPKIKNVIRSVSMKDAKNLANELLKCNDRTEISRVIKRFKYR